MKSILLTRGMHWKKHWLTLLLWLLLPLMATIGIVTIIDSMKAKSSIPVGIVVEDDSPAAKELLKQVASTSFVHVYQLEKENARHQLKKHQLDSIFIIHDGYGEDIFHDNRNQLLTGYRSDLSFAYTPVKEMILSYIQQQTGRSKAVHTVQELTGQYASPKQWTRDEIVTKADEIQLEENLLTSSFSFGKTASSPNNDTKLINIWGIWASFTLLATLLLFDWIIHEKHASIRLRFAFMRWSLKHYLILNFMIYTTLCLIFDGITIVTFWLMLGERIPIWSWICFRLFLNMAIFLFSNLFKRSFHYYMTAFALTLIFAIGSGAIIPVNGIINRWPWITELNPIQPFLDGEYWNLSSLVILVLAFIWYCRKEEFYASR